MVDWTHRSGRRCRFSSPSRAAEMMLDRQTDLPGRSFSWAILPVLSSFEAGFAIDGLPVVRLEYRPMHRCV
jgi:hypothetical protein